VGRRTTRRSNGVTGTGSPSRSRRIVGLRGTTLARTSTRASRTGTSTTGEGKTSARRSEVEEGKIDANSPF
jgi:hypothetical protein